MGLKTAFSPRIPAGEVKINKIGAKDLDEFYSIPYDENRVLLRFRRQWHQATKQDRLVLYYLIDELIERTVFITANISAVIGKTGSGTTCRRSV